MSSYNPYANTLSMKAEQHVAVSRANHDDMGASGSGYEDPLPSYSEAAPGSFASQRAPDSAYRGQWAPDVAHNVSMPAPTVNEYTSRPGSTVYQQSPYLAPQDALHDKSAGRPPSSASHRSVSPSPGAHTPHPLHGHYGSHAPNASHVSLASSASHTPRDTQGSSSTSTSGGLSNLIPRGKDVHSLIDPPPPSFLRRPSPSFPYGPFEPLEVLAAGKRLDDGFVATLPFSATQPHPFATHDVMEEDWMRFLGDLKLAGSLSIRDKVISGLAPAAIGLGIIPGLLVSFAIDSHMKKKKQKPVDELIGYWNECFFKHRRMEVLLAKGTSEEAHTHGRTSPSPQSPHHPGHAVPDNFAEHEKPMSRREEKRARKAERREEKHARKAERREEKRARRKAKHRDSDSDSSSDSEAGHGHARRASSPRRSEPSGSSSERWRLVVRYKPVAAYAT
ncbi:hypothetical protein OH77DRAFT_1418220 [Trametes cingulata]|nr:hypothetical protein OH77DRAFT_1418220 [Trametes cingulata]